MKKSQTIEAMELVDNAARAHVNLFLITLQCLTRLSIEQLDNVHAYVTCAKNAKIKRMENEDAY